MATLRVGQIGNFLHEHCTEVHLREAMLANGWEATPYQENDLAAWGQLTASLDGLDFVLWTRTGWAEPVPHEPQLALLAAAKTASVPVVGYHLDRWIGLAREAQLTCEPYFGVDLLVTADGGHDEVWERHGIAHEWLPPGVSDPETRRTSNRRREWSQVQVGFVGSGRRYHPEWQHRQELLGWLRRTYRRRFQHWEGGIRGQDLADLYATVPVLVGDSCLAGGASRYWSDRIPETLGRGGFLLHPNVEGLEEHFTPGVHLATWNPGDWGGLRWQVDHYLADQSTARAIADAGRAHVQKHHTYEVRMRQLADVLDRRGLVTKQRPTVAPSPEPVTCDDCGGHLRGQCRACHRKHAQPVTNLEPVLCLGRVPLANDLRHPEDPEPERFPLHLACCAACGAVQVTDPVDPSAIFTEAYPYRSSVNGPMVESARVLVNRLCDERALGPDDWVVEVGSNDGYLLQHYRDRGVQVLGIDPAPEAAAEANERGITTRVALFSAEYATKVLHGNTLSVDRISAAVVHANNVLAHIPDVTDALRGIAAILAPDGIAVVETPYLPDLLAQRAFDTIYHEHVYYWSATAFARAARRAGLTLVGVERFELHGGSLRMTLVRAGCGQPSESVRELLEAEVRVGMAEPSVLKGFADEVAAVTTQLRQVIVDERMAGRTIAAYGAAAKGVMLLNACGLTADDVAWCADSTPGKQGRVLPGSGVPVVDPQRLTDDPPDVVLLLAWNFADAIVAKHPDFGGRWIIPLPWPHVR